ncbi:MAG: hypothetical protein QW412_04000 [Candidatus Aenigmatarchaeota archaeon]
MIVVVIDLLLIGLAIAIELVAIWTLVVLNAFPAIQKGYWYIAWVPILGWVVLSIVSIYGCYFLAKTVRKKVKKR